MASSNRGLSLLLRWLVIAMGVFQLLFIAGAIVTLGAAQSLAFKKTVYASNGDIPPSHAVDGNTDNDWYKGSCTFASSSPTDGSQWLMVDLGRRYDLNTVTIYNEYNYRDGSLNVNLYNFVEEVFLSNPVTFPGQPSQLCAAHEGMLTLSATLNCSSGTAGRFARIRKLDTKAYHGFTVCEFEVAGTLAGCLFPMTFQKMTGSQLVTSASPILVSSSSAVDCASQCLKKPGCQGFNFNIVKTVCEMLMTSDVQNIMSHGDWEMNYLTYIYG